MTSSLAPETLPPIRYPAELPISVRVDELRTAIRDHQVVIVAGETGSGKTTQLPKICLELGRGQQGRIGHTQPRRLAARTVAERVAEELDTTLGETVGYQVRFHDQVTADSRVKVMTDGVLLAEIQHDRELRQYDTIIIDEAHERSLNIDFLLGYLRQLLPRRPDLTLIITSATIDPQRFSRRFDDAPVIEVSGRTYPVEVRYRPLPDGEGSRDQPRAICDAVRELIADGPGDILVFCSGEREIRDAADALGKLGLTDTEIVPLFARLSAAEQHRVFQPHPGRRIVLATNVAETSLTVPGIRYVIDPGTARISRYSHRLKVQRLPIEPISQASARQRAGRCGRTSDGVCIRLYAEDDFDARPAFTEPEIVRTNLASVILAMASLQLGALADFPFVDPPDTRAIRDGENLLRELGALETHDSEQPVLTGLGRRLARLPVDPRLGRMVLEAERTGAVREVLIIAAALSIQDPRERPADRQQAADEAHARFADEHSDFLGYRNLWDYLRERQRELSSNQFRRLCRSEFLHYLRVREWQDLHAQLRRVVRRLGIVVNDEPAGSAKVHQALLAGLLSHIGMRDGDSSDYLGARGARFAVFPGSTLFAKPPRWVMAAELVETSRLWGRCVARIDPAWIEPLAAHLVVRNFSEPHWESKRGAVMAYERVTLFGVPIVVGRRVNYSRIDPELCRDLFIRHALVEGEWRTHHQFFHDNRVQLADAEEWEHRARRRDLVVDDETLVEFYDRRIPAHVVSARHFDRWWKQTRRQQPDLLTFTPGMLVGDGANGVQEADYPDVWRQGQLTLPLSYQFEPGTDADGVTVHIPLPLLTQLRAADFEWQIPGLREELVTALLRSLPKAVRRSFVPAPNWAKAVLAELAPVAGREPLLPALSRELRVMTGMTGTDIPAEAWDLERVPAHLRMTFRVLDDAGQVLAEGTDLAALRRHLTPHVREVVAEAAHDVERSGLVEWSFGTLPQTVERHRNEHVLTGFPALVDEGSSVAVRVLGSATAQQRAMWSGTRRLLLLATADPVRKVAGRLDTPAKLALSANPHGGLRPLFDDCVVAVVDELMAERGGPGWDAAGFDRLRAAVDAELAERLFRVVSTVAEILAVSRDVEAGLASATSPALRAAVEDVRGQHAALIRSGFVAATGARRLPHLVRYLRAMLRRLETVPRDVERDRVRMRRIEQAHESYRRLLAQLPADAAADARLREIPWMIEELRVSFFAQQLGTAYPVSEERIWRVIDDLAA